MSARAEAAAWTEAVQGYANHRRPRYDRVGGLNPVGGPVALCPGGTNRITGELVDGFWGASCDADEHEQGGLFSKAIVPGAVLVKALMPDVARVVPIFNVESLERTPEDMMDSRSRRRVEFESIDFNRRFIATVPREHDPIQLRELFSPAFIDWITRIPAEVDFGITDRQLFFHWVLRARSQDELEEALRHGGGIFVRLQGELSERGMATLRPGPWNAGLEPFPPQTGT